MTLRDEILTVIIKSTSRSGTFHAKDATDEILALIQPRFDEIRELCEKAHSELSCISTYDKHKVNKPLKQAITLCTLDEPPEPDDKKLKISIFRVIMDAEIYNNDMMDNIMTLIKESDGE